MQTTVHVDCVSISNGVSFVLTCGGYKQVTMSSTFRCLYTKHKTQKRKVWQDGSAKLTQGSKVLLVTFRLSHSRTASLAADTSSGVRECAR